MITNAVIWFTAIRQQLFQFVCCVRKCEDEEDIATKEFCPSLDRKKSRDISDFNRLCEGKEETMEQLFQLNCVVRKCKNDEEIDTKEFCPSLDRKDYRCL